MANIWAVRSNAKHYLSEKVFAAECSLATHFRCRFILPKVFLHHPMYLPPSLLAVIASILFFLVDSRGCVVSVAY